MFPADRTVKSSPRVCLFALISPLLAGDAVGNEPAKNKTETQNCFQTPVFINGGSDETRTRDLRRDRPAF